MDAPARTARRLTLSLDPDTYNKLAEQAEASERDPLQQARFILRQALTATPQQAKAGSR